MTPSLFLSILNSLAITAGIFCSIIQVTRTADPIELGVR
jgi:hypothetical protein